MSTTYEPTRSQWVLGVLWGMRHEASFWCMERSYIANRTIRMVDGLMASQKIPGSTFYHTRRLGVWNFRPSIIFKKTVHCVAYILHAVCHLEYLGLGALLIESNSSRWCTSRTTKARRIVHQVHSPISNTPRGYFRIKRPTILTISPPQPWANAVYVWYKIPGGAETIR